MFELDEIRLRFDKRLALEIGALHLDGGSSVAVMGPNGSGKTTLLRLLADLVEPTSGSVTGTAGGVAGRRPSVAYVGQHHHQHTWMPLTVNEVLRMGRYRQRGLLGRLDGGDRRLLAEAAARLEIDDIGTRSFGELSGGQRQRVLVAGALAGLADCLLLDEPITGLDLPSQQLILDVVAEERDRGRLVVLTTHHLEEARHCDRVLLLNTELLADGKPDEVLIPSELARTFGPRMIADPVGVGTDADNLIIVFDEHGHGRHHGPDGHHPEPAGNRERAPDHQLGRATPTTTRGES